MIKPGTVAIDGPGAVGKNAVGRLVAREMGYRFLDTGAMYRAVTWLALEQGIGLEDEEALSELAAGVQFDLVPQSDGDCSIMVNGRSLGPELRSQEVDRGVSLVAKVGGVRGPLVASQQQLAEKGGVVMVGRDIGTVVLPQADLKLYLIASAEERARRRFLELDGGLDYDEVLADLKRRDSIDSERNLSPLQPALDARIVDTDGLDLSQVVAEVMNLIEERQ